MNFQRLSRRMLCALTIGVGLIAQSFIVATASAQQQKPNILFILADNTGYGDIGVYGGAAQDANFTGDGDRVRYSVDVPAGAGPFQVDVELLFQPIGYRWAHNLEKYDAFEPKRFVGYYNATASGSSVVVAKATTTQP